MEIRKSDETKDILREGSLVDAFDAMATAHGHLLDRVGRLPVGQWLNGLPLFLLNKADKGVHVSGTLELTEDAVFDTNKIKIQMLKKGQTSDGKSIYW